MLHSDWQSFLHDHPPRYAAAIPVADATEIAAAIPVADATGIAYLETFTAMRFQGTDVVKFLQGYLTCDTGLLRTEALTPTALCNLKGRVVMNGWCWQPDETQILVAVHRSLSAALQDYFRTYLRFSRTTLTDAGAELLLFGGLDLDATAGGLVLDSRRRLFPVTELAVAQALWQQQEPISEAHWLASLIADRVPLIDTRTSERFLPQMLNLQTLGAIDFTKGCYLGQEVVARAQHLGQVKRSLTLLGWSHADPSELVPGAELRDSAGRTAGTLVNVAVAPGANGGTALAVVQTDAAGPFRTGAEPGAPLLQRIPPAATGPAAAPATTNDAAQGDTGLRQDP